MKSRAPSSVTGPSWSDSPMSGSGVKRSRFPARDRKSKTTSWEPRAFRLLGRQILIFSTWWLVSAGGRAETSVTSISASRLEGATGQSLLTFTLQRSPVEPQELRLPYAFVPGGTATPGNDFTVPGPGEFVFAAGAATATATVTILGDAAIEPNESIWLRLMPPDGVRVREKWRVTTPPAWAAAMPSRSSVWAQAMSHALVAWQDKSETSGEFRLVAWWRGMESDHQWRQTRSLPLPLPPGPLQWSGTMAADGNRLALALGEGAGLRLVVNRYDPSTDTWAEEASLPVPVLDGYAPMVFNLHLRGTTLVATVRHQGEFTAPLHVIHAVRRQPNGSWQAEPPMTASPPLFQMIADVLENEDTLIVRSFEDGFQGMTHHRLFQRSGPPAAPWLVQWDLAPVAWAPAPLAMALGRHLDGITLYGQFPQNTAQWEFARWEGNGQPPLAWMQTGSLQGTGEIRAGLDQGAPVYLFAENGSAKLMTHSLPPDGSYLADEAIVIPGSYPALLTVGNGGLLAAGGAFVPPTLAERVIVEGIIADDDGLSFSALDTVVAEPANGSVDAVIEVQASQRLGSAVSVNWQTVPDTAQAPGDFAAASGVLTIPAGAISGTIRISVSADQDFEGMEHFRVRLVGASAGSVARSDAMVALQDEDVPRLSTATPRVFVEGDAGNQPWVNSISLPSAPSADTAVPIRIGGTARSGLDFTLADTSIVWPAGQRTVAFPWQGLGDVLTEPEETLTVSSWRPGIPVAPSARWSHAGALLDSPQQISAFAIDGDQLAMLDEAPPESRIHFYGRHPVAGWQLSQSAVIGQSGDYKRLALKDKQCLIAVGSKVHLWQRREPGWEFQRILNPDADSGSGRAAPVALSDSVAALPEGVGSGLGLSIHYRHFGGNEAWGRAKHIVLETNNPGADQISDMALEGDWLVVGRQGYEYVAENNYFKGAVEVRHRNQGGPDQWGVVTRMLNTQSEPSTTFGSQVALSGRTLAIRLSGLDTPSHGIAIYENTGEAFGTWNRITAFPAPWNELSPFALNGEWLAIVDATRRIDRESLRERELTIRHRNAGGPGAWGTAVTALASNLSLAGIGFEGPNLMLAHSKFFADKSFIDGWEASDQAVYFIQDDDPAPVIMSLSDATVVEGSSTIGMTGLAQSPAPEDVTIDFEIVPITAQPGSDLAPVLQGTALLGANSTEFKAWVNLLNDAIPEPDETFLVRLTGISRGKIVAQSATGTVLDNDVDTRNAKILLPFDNPVRAQASTAATYALEWREPGFDDSSWLTGTQGVGYENEPASANSYVPHLGLDMRTSLFNVNPGVLIRLPFTLPSPLPEGGRWLLRHRADDGMILWINGHQVAQVRAPSRPVWNSTASEPSPEPTGLPPANTVLPTVRDFLTPGANMAAVHGMNLPASSSDFLIQLELSHFPILASSYLDAVTASGVTTVSNYWPTDDVDKDGFTNGHEFAAGSDPLNPANQPLGPPLQVSHREDGQLVLEVGFGTLPEAARIEIESSTSLSESAWSLVARRAASGPWQLVPPASADGLGRLIVPTAPGVAQSFYRCVIHVDTQ